VHGAVARRGSELLLRPGLAVRRGRPPVRSAVAETLEGEPSLTEDELPCLDARVDDAVVLVEPLDVSEVVVLKGLVVGPGRAPGDRGVVEGPEIGLDEALLTAGEPSGKPHYPTSMVSRPVMAAKMRPPTMNPAGGKIM